MKVCPKCGRPMTLVQRMSGDDSRREWRCQDREYVIGDACTASEEIPPEKQLSVADIADDMARTSFHSSKEARTGQTGLRRVAGSIKKLKWGIKYLSNRERKTLMAAAAILERLGAAAERAKRERKRLEDEEKERRAQRRIDAEARSRHLFSADDAVGRAITVFVLAQLCNRHPPWSADWVARLQSHRQRGISLRMALEREIEAAFNRLLSDFVDDQAWRREPVAELIAAAKHEYDQIRATIYRDPVIEKLREVLAIESGSNVVRLVKKD